VAVGDNGTILTSGDGVRWRSTPAAVTDWLRAVAIASDGTAVAVGWHELILTRP